ncbi:MAG TPA: hypothetical protein VHY32_04615 [Caulobacteraceae bacterium]|nr:hypothetical protein [Caulobacteraceae bacterium]
MTTPIEFNSVSSADRYPAESEFEGFSLEMSSRDDDDSGLYEEISERRALLENADILRGARAL